MDGYDALAAARDSAYWAAAAALAAWLIGLITLVVNGGGILLLWRQLKISEDAALAARDAVRIAAAETRPWLQLGFSKLEGYVQFDPPRVRVWGFVDINNIGKTPALSAGMLARLLIDPSRNDIISGLEELRGQIKTRNTIIFPSQILPTQFWLSERVDADDFRHENEIIVLVVANYSSGAEEHETSAVIAVWPKADEMASVVGWKLEESTTQPLDHSPLFAVPVVPT